MKERMFMKCPHCESEYSDSVIPFHTERCEGNPANVEPVEDLKEKPLDKKTIPELKEYAELHKIDIGDATKKEDILAKLEGGAANGGQPN
jgi:endogenous inhibitor of DNA gyrase (YacG/DUF329 family)